MFVCPSWSLSISTTLAKIKTFDAAVKLSLSLLNTNITKDNCSFVMIKSQNEWRGVCAISCIEIHYFFMFGTSFLIFSMVALIQPYEVRKV